MITTNVRIRRGLVPLAAVMAVAAALAAGGPVAGASTVRTDGSTGLVGLGWQDWLGVSPGGAAAGDCGSATTNQGQGRTGTTNQVCGGLSFTGPAIGQISNVIGPTIISPGVAGATIVNGNNIEVGV